MTADKLFTNVSLFQGATVKRDVSTGAIVVARIMRGGAADLSGKKHFNLFLKVRHCVLAQHFIQC